MCPCCAASSACRAASSPSRSKSGCCAAGPSTNRPLPPVNDPGASMNQPINPTGADLASFEKLTADPSAADAATQSANGDVNLEVILEVPVTLSMEVGRTRIPIRNLLQLNQGSVVELDRAAGELLDVFVNGTLVAHGEVVVVNDKFGIRLTDVVSPAERIRKLK
ncbi:MAG: flagellar motor switch protein FliN [Gammaproteobacteria bacterium]